MSLLLNMLSRLVMTFLPRSKCLLISWLQSPSAVILEPRKIKSDTVSTVPHLFPMKWWDRMPWSSFSECWALSQLFHSTLSLSSRGFLVPLHFLPQQCCCCCCCWVTSVVSDSATPWTAVRHKDRLRTGSYFSGVRPALETSWRPVRPLSWTPSFKHHSKFKMIQICNDSHKLVMRECEWNFLYYYLLAVLLLCSLIFLFFILLFFLRPMYVFPLRKQKLF